MISAIEQRASEFATERHAGHVRKFTGEPYIVHPAAVADLVRSVPHSQAMLAAAWLHDTIEDTPTTYAEIRGLFGPDVAELVSMLTRVRHAPGVSRQERAKIDARFIGMASNDGKTIKLADIFDNCSTISARDPEFAQTYLAEKAAMLPALNGGHRILYARVSDLLCGFG